VFGAGERKLKCQPCHGEIAALVRARAGYHGRVFVPSKGDVDCVRCHTEHYGENFRIYKWETSKEEFDHKQAGYVLVGKHSGLKCEQCHVAKNISPADRSRIKVKDLNRTFEGLHTACLTCHVDAHAGQLGTDCEKCHSFTGWKPVKTAFDHSTTKYPLTGKHRDVECAKCHKPLPTNAKVVQYTGLSFETCTPCHQDPHRGAFKQRCEECHETEVWKRVRSSNGFDHATTKFPLDGKHRDVPCLKCHPDSNFKTPVAHKKCMDCHKDQHKGQFLHRADGGECGPCHTAADWHKSTFTEASHKDTPYPVTGKHKGVACAKCHLGTGLDTDYHPKFKACLDCHHTDVHDRQFADPPRANKCDDCHTVDGFTPATYTIRDHQSSRFALKSAHLAVTCVDCHQKGGPEAKAHPDAGWTFRFPDLKCVGCHQDPHSGDFPKTLTGEHAAVPDVCESCHSATRWQQLKTFDHSQTDYPLTGAHQVLGCLACHRPVGPEAANRQLPFKVSSKCDGCHEDIHDGQFRGKDNTQDCSRCHTTTRWMATLFDHEKSSTFSLRGAHQDVPCKMCHETHLNDSGRKLTVYKNTPSECKSCHR
jgi:predicted CXXCH cytochrome family protein